MPEPVVVLITGCSTGIGRATAERLVRGGHTVYATARKLEAIADLEAAGCKTLALDVTDEASMQAAVDTVVAAEGTIGALVNNAGYSQSGAIETVPPEALRRQFETNVFGLMRMCQLVLPSMREAGRGRIVNISSMGANFTFPGGGVYHSTKYAIEAISDALRFEVKGFGVDVTVIQPGLIRSEFAESAAAGVDAGGGPYAQFNANVVKVTKQTYEKGPLARLGGDPDDVAKSIEQAITASKPKIRALVTASAHLLVNQRKLMTDGLWDRFLATQFKHPGRE